MHVDIVVSSFGHYIFPRLKVRMGREYRKDLYIPIPHPSSPPPANSESILVLIANYTHPSGCVLALISGAILNISIGTSANLSNHIHTKGEFCLCVYSCYCTRTTRPPSPPLTHDLGSVHLAVNTFHCQSYPGQILTVI